MFEAEVRRRTGEEDLLTSRVFGCLCLLDKQLVLAPFLKSLGMSLQNEEIPGLSLKLWKAYGGVEPDVTIESQNQVAFVEVKLESPTSRDQLEREYREGMKLRKPFSLFLLTKDYRAPQALREAQQYLSQDYPSVAITWVRWQHVYHVLKELANQDSLDQVSRSLLLEVLRLLEAKRLRGASGVRKEWLAKVVEAQQPVALLYEEASVIAQELNNRVIKEGLEPVSPGGGASNLDRDGRGSSLSDPGGWATTYLEFAYRDANWPVTYFVHRHLYVRFYTIRDVVDVGFIILCSQGRAQQDILATQSALLERLTREESIEAVLIPRNARKGSDQGTMVDAASRLDPDTLRGFQWLDLRYRLPSSHLGSPDVVDRCLRLLLSMRDLVNEVGLDPKPVATNDGEDDVESEPNSST